MMSSFNFSVLESSDGERLFQYLRQKQGRQAKPARLFDSVNDDKGVEIDIPIEIVQVAANQDSNQTKRGADLQKENVPIREEPHNPKENLSNQRFSLMKNKSRRFSPVRAFVKRCSVDLGRRVLRQEFEKTVNGSQIFKPIAASTPLHDIVQPNDHISVSSENNVGTSDLQRNTSSQMNLPAPSSQLPEVHEPQSEHAAIDALNSDIQPLPEDDVTLQPTLSDKTLQPSASKAAQSDNKTRQEQRECSQHKTSQMETTSKNSKNMSTSKRAVVRETSKQVTLTGAGSSSSSSDSDINNDQQKGINKSASESRKVMLLSREENAFQIHSQPPQSRPELTKSPVVELPKANSQQPLFVIPIKQTFYGQTDSDKNRSSATNKSTAVDNGILQSPKRDAMTNTHPINSLKKMQSSTNERENSQQNLISDDQLIVKPRKCNRSKQFLMTSDEEDGPTEFVEPSQAKKTAKRVSGVLDLRTRRSSHNVAAAIPADKVYEFDEDDPHPQCLAPNTEPMCRSPERYLLQLVEDDEIPETQEFERDHRRDGRDRSRQNKMNKKQIESPTKTCKTATQKNLSETSSPEYRATTSRTKRKRNQDRFPREARGRNYERSRHRYERRSPSDDIRSDQDYRNRARVRSKSRNQSPYDYDAKKYKTHISPLRQRGEKHRREYDNKQKSIWDTDEESSTEYDEDYYLSDRRRKGYVESRPRARRDLYERDERRTDRRRWKEGYSSNKQRDPKYHKGSKSGDSTDTDRSEKRHHYHRDKASKRYQGETDEISLISSDEYEGRDYSPNRKRNKSRKRSPQPNNLNRHHNRKQREKHDERNKRIDKGSKQYQDDSEQDKRSCDELEERSDSDQIEKRKVPLESNYHKNREQKTRDQNKLSKAQDANRKRNANTKNHRSLQKSDREDHYSEPERGRTNQNRSKTTIMEDSIQKQNRQNFDEIEELPYLSDTENVNTTQRVLPSSQIDTIDDILDIIADFPTHQQETSAVRRRSSRNLGNEFKNIDKTIDTRQKKRIHSNQRRSKSRLDISEIETLQYSELERSPTISDKEPPQNDMVEASTVEPRTKKRKESASETQFKLVDNEYIDEMSPRTQQCWVDTILDSQEQKEQLAPSKRSKKRGKRVITKKAADPILTSYMDVTADAFRKSIRTQKNQSTSFNRRKLYSKGNSDDENAIETCPENDDNNLNNTPHRDTITQVVSTKSPTEERRAEISIDDNIFKKPTKRPPKAVSKSSHSSHSSQTFLSPHHKHGNSTSENPRENSKSRENTLETASSSSSSSSSNNAISNDHESKTKKTHKSSKSNSRSNKEKKQEAAGTIVESCPTVEENDSENGPRRSTRKRLPPQQYWVFGSDKPIRPINYREEKPIPTLAELNKQMRIVREKMRRKKMSRKNKKLVVPMQSVPEDEELQYYNPKPSTLQNVEIQDETHSRYATEETTLMTPSHAMTSSATRPYRATSTTTVSTMTNTSLYEHHIDSGTGSGEEDSRPKSSNRSTDWINHLCDLDSASKQNFKQIIEIEHAKLTSISEMAFKKHGSVEYAEYDDPSQGVIRLPPHSTKKKCRSRLCRLQLLVISGDLTIQVALQEIDVTGGHVLTIEKDVSYKIMNKTNSVALLHYTKLLENSKSTNPL